MIRFHGVFAGHAADRVAPTKQLALAGIGEEEDVDDERAPARKPWAWLCAVSPGDHMIERLKQAMVLRSQSSSTLLAFFRCIDSSERIELRVAIQEPWESILRGRAP
jgi:hypothetical protein